MAENRIEQDSVYGLAATPDFLEGGRCFAARASGLYVSSDGGRTWRDAYRSLALKTPLTTATVALSPQPAPETTVFAGALGGVLRSTDSGENWLTATLPTPPPYVVAIAVSPEYESDGLVFAATMEDGVFRSWDRGASWAAWNFGLLDLNVYALAISPDFGRDETLYVGTESGIFSSTNGGRAWREVPFAMEAAPVLSLALSPGYGADGILLAGTEASGLFRSADRGASWQRVYEWDGDSAVNQLVVANTGSGSWVLMALAGTSVSYSRDGGSHWRSLPAAASLDAAPTCICAPQGLAAGEPLLLGLEDGRVILAEIPDWQA